MNQRGNRYCHQAVDRYPVIMVKPRIIKSGGSGWKPIALDPSVFKANDLEGLIGIEELTDYSIGRVKPAKVLQFLSL